MLQPLRSVFEVPGAEPGAMLAEELVQVGAQEAALLPPPSEQIKAAFPEEVMLARLS